MKNMFWYINSDNNAINLNKMDQLFFTVKEYGKEKDTLVFIYGYLDNKAHPVLIESKFPIIFNHNVDPIAIGNYIFNSFIRKIDNINFGSLFEFEEDYIIWLESTISNDICKNVNGKFKYSTNNDDYPIGVHIEQSDLLIYIRDKQLLDEEIKKYFDSAEKLNLKFKIVEWQDICGSVKIGSEKNR